MSFNEIFGTLLQDILSGTFGDDQIFGLDGDDSLYGNDGNDQLYGGEGNDYLDGGNGFDTLYGENHQDSLYGGANDDYLDGGNGKDELYGGQGNDFLSGYNGKDKLYGEEGFDFIQGGAGQDELYGGQGNDSLYGDGGNDFLSGGTGDDLIVGGEGDDSAEGGDGNDTLYGEAGNDTLRGDLGNDILYGNEGNDSLLGGDGDDSLAGNEEDDYLEGEAGADNLNGGSGNDTVKGGDGNDFLYGDLGDDSLNGDADNDIIIGADGNDTIDGGAGDDGWLAGEAGNDIINGGIGNDVIDGGIGNDTLDGNEGDDPWINGNEGTDVVNGGAGNDVIDGGAGNDVVSGDDGADIVIGNTGDDTLSGGIGNDLVYGDAGNDVFLGTITDVPGSSNSIDLFAGGAGADTFVLGDANKAFYNDGDSNSAGENNYVVLADFDRLQDTIELYGSAELYAVEESPFNTNNAAIYFDSNGDGTHDELIAVVDHLSSQEFFLDQEYINYTNGPVPGSSHPSQRSDWELVFSDEFDGTALNLDKWDTSYYYGSRTNTFNNEEQYYVDDAFEFNNGVMSIVGEKLDTPMEAFETVDQELLTEQGKDLFFDYTSGMISGHDHNAFTYGYMEISAKVPMGQSLWPAFWMLPSSGEWPPEIDIMEILNETDPNTNQLETNLYTTLHTAAPSGDFSQQSAYSGMDFSTGFHTFAAEWDPNSITWSVDGVELFTVDSGITTEPMYLLANLAIGGDWPGATNANTPEYSTLDIDYIRVYQNSQGTLHGGIGDDDLSRQNGNLAGEGGDDNLAVTGLGSLYGGSGNDTLIGGSGDNLLDGGEGDDVLSDGQGRDTFTGAAGSDRFILGANGDKGYDSAAGNDYAVITDFSTTEDVIQLTGISHDYLLGVNQGNNEIYWDSNNNTSLDSADDLIAVINNTAALNLTQNYFDFV